MQLPIKDIHTECSPLGSEESFGIGNVGLIINILRNKLYSDPVGSIVREYISNARDAHIEVNKKDVPIEIYFPHNFDLNIRIKDFGPGISPDRMSNVFIKYANSTKRNDNSQIGMWGIGAKSAFAYTNQFTIITITAEENSRNIKRTYIAYIDETEIGKMRMVSQSETDESTGTEIIIAIDPNDIKQFIAAVIKYTNFWNVRPILKGISQLPTYPEKSKVVLSGDGWELFEQHSYYNFDEKSTAVVDGIPYPISVNSLKNLTDSEKKFLSSYMRLYFATGELMVSASREQLHYDENTEKVIRNKVKQVFDDIKKYLSNEINSIPTYKEAVLKLELIKKNISYAISKTCYPTWNGHTIFGPVLTVPHGLYLKIAAYSIEISRRSREKYIARNTGESLYITDNSEIYVNDGAKHISRDKINAIFAGKNLTTVYVIYSDDKIENQINEWKNPTKQLVKYEPFDLWILNPGLLSNIKPLKSGTSKPKERFNGWVFDIKYDPYKCKNSDRSWRPVQIDKKSGSEVYIRLNDGTDKIATLLKNNKLETISKTLINSLSKAIGKEIYGIRASDIEKLGSKWIPLHQAIKDKFKEINTNLNIDDILLANFAKNEGCTFNSLFTEQIRKIFTSYANKNPNSEIAEYIKESKRLYDIMQVTENYFYLLQCLEVKEIDFKKSKIYNMHQNIELKYPLLDHLNTYVSCNDSHIFEYISLIDEKLDKSDEKLVG